MAIPFEIEVNENEGVHIVSLSGALDAATLDEFTETMIPIISGPRPSVILHCDKLHYTNSRSIGHMSQYHRTATAKQGKLVFSAMSDRLQRSFERLRVMDNLLLCDTKEEALAQFVDRD